MVTSVINAVTKQLGTTFGNTYQYYMEDIEQGVKKPCFHVSPRITLQRSRSPVLYDRTVPIVVHYFSDNLNNLKKDCYSMGEKVYGNMAVVKSGNYSLAGSICKLGKRKAFENVVKNHQDSRNAAQPVKKFVVWLSIGKNRR